MRLEGIALAARDADIINDANAGFTLRELAARHGIGFIRIRQILRNNRNDLTRVNATKPSRSLQPDYHALKLAFSAGTGHDSPHLAIRAGERTLAEWCAHVGSWRVA